MTFDPQEIPKNFDFASRQPEIYEHWESSGCFNAEPNPDKKPFTIVIPPPNVTGALHLGHGLNNTLQDIQIRMHRMMGFEALWMPGTDHAGIATQARVEKRIREDENKTRHDLGREELVRRIFEWKDEYEKRILGQLKQMGCSCDWRRTRFTLDEQCARAVRYTFFDLFKKSFIFRGKKLVNWDMKLGSAVSDDEIETKEIKGKFWHLKYPVVDPKPGEPEFLIVATTRPETMLGDTAVAVHPNPAKALDKVTEELNSKLASAKDKEKPAIQVQIEAVQQRRESMLADLELYRDMANDGRKVMLPLMNREIPIVCDQWAKPELGSGCVKITPAHDPNDYEVGKRQNLTMINIMNPNGTMNSESGEYAGLEIVMARKKIVAAMEELELVDQIDDKVIDLPLSDRSKEPIEPFLADQWFVKMTTLAQNAMDAVTDERVEIFPTRYRKGYLDWLGEKRDWPVSRQLWWGHQIPVWSRKCETKEELESLQAKLEPLSDAQPESCSLQVEFDDPNSKIVGAGDETIYATIHICLRDEGDPLAQQLEELGLVREEDVLDTWFSSALWPHSTLGWPEETPELDYFYPGSVLITSRDIITLWVARMVLSGLNNCNDIPFREVFIHPKILDGYGETMSKSKGNGIDPLDVIQKFGADSLRFGMAHLCTETQDVRLPCQFECPHCNKPVEQTKKNRELALVSCASCGKAFSTQWARTDEELATPRGPVLSERFENSRNFVNKLWNASRFAMINLEGYTAAPVTDEQLQIEDRWILSRLATVTQEATDALKTYKYSEAARLLHEFAWDDFCSFYVEILKSRFRNEEQKPIAQRLLAHAMDQLLRLLHPIMPFVTEEIWGMLGQLAAERGLESPAAPSDQLIQADWPTADASKVCEPIESQFSTFQNVLAALREIRQSQNLSHKDKIEFCLRCNQETSELLEPMLSYFESMAGATSTGMSSEQEAPKTNATRSFGGIDVFVDLKDFIDEDAERARLEKEETRTIGLIAGKESKLGNANFTDRAPVEIVQRERDSLVELQKQLESLRKALADLGPKK